MATIVWVNEQGKTVRSHTLDPESTRREIAAMGGRVVDVERPGEVKTVLRRDPETGRLEQYTPSAYPEPEGEVVVEPEPEPEEEKKPLPLGPPGIIPSLYGRDPAQEIAARLKAVPPIPEPGVFERPGTTATPEQLGRLPPPKEGIIPIGLPPSEVQVREEQEVKIRRAEREAGERIEVERGVFEARERPIAQDVTQDKYNELIGKKAVELGMTFDSVRGTWVGDESQIERFREYEPEARVEAMTFGTDFYQRQWEQLDFGERAEDITREEFAEEGFKLIEKDGTFTVITEKEFKKRERITAERERIRERITGTPEERISEFTRFVSLSLLKPVSFLAPVIGEAILGEDKGEQILDIYAGRVEELRGKGIGEVALSSYTDPGGLGFIGTAAALFPAGLGLLGKIPGAGGAIIAKGIPTVVAFGVIPTIVGTEIGITAAKEKPFDPTKGLEQIPEALFTGEAGKRFIQYGAALSLFVGFGYAATRGPVQLPKLGKIQRFDATTGIATQKFGLIVGQKQPIGIRLPFTQVKQFQFLPRETGLVPFRQQPVPFAEVTPIPTTTFIPIGRPTGFERNIINIEKEVFKTTIIYKGLKTTFIDIGGPEKVLTVTPTRKLTIETIQRDITLPKIEIIDKPTKDFIPKSFEKEISEVIPADFFAKQIKPITFEVFGPKAKSILPPHIKEIPELGARRQPIKISEIEPSLPKSITKEFRSLATLIQARRAIPTKSLYRPVDVKPIIETFPSREILVKVDPLFFKKIITKQGIAAEFKIDKTTIITKVFEGKSLIPETIVKTDIESLRGLGQIFKPTIPGEFIFSKGRFFGAKERRIFEKGGEVKPVFIGEREAFEVFAGKIGKDPLAAVGKISIPEALIDPKELGIIIRNIDQSLFTFSTKAQTTLSQIGTIKGIGKTFPETKLTIRSPLRGFKIEITPFVTKGDIVIGGRKIPVESFGKIVDATEGHIRGTVTDSEKSLLSQFFKTTLVPAATIQAVAVAAVSPLKITDVLTKTITAPVQKTKIGIISKGQEQLITNVMKTSQLQIGKQATKQVVSTKTEEETLTRQISKEQTKQVERQLSKTGVKVITKQISEPITRQVSKSLSKQIAKTMTEQITKVATKQISKQTSKLETKLVTKLIEKQTIKGIIVGAFAETVITPLVPGVVPPSVKPPDEIIIKPPTPPVGILGLQDTLMKGVSLVPQAYDVYTYKTQFKDGKRIRGKEPMKINKKPLRRLDALAVGSNVVDNNAKRTIILKPVEGKPHRPRKKVRGWSSQMFEYNDKGNDIWVEKNRHAIDSPGEIREITMKGLAARKKGGKRSNSGLSRSISSLENRMSRRMII